MEFKHDGISIAILDACRCNFYQQINEKLVGMSTKIELRILNSAFLLRKNLFFVEHMSVSMPQINQGKLMNCF